MLLELSLDLLVQQLVDLLEMVLDLVMVKMLVEMLVEQLLVIQLNKMDMNDPIWIINMINSNHLHKIPYLHQYHRIHNLHLDTIQSACPVIIINWDKNSKNTQTKHRHKQKDCNTQPRLKTYISVLKKSPKTESIWSQADGSQRSHQKTKNTKFSFHFTKTTKISTKECFETYFDQKT